MPDKETIRVSGDDVVQYARTWLGVPWVHQGRSRQGVDCAGVLIKTTEHFYLPGEDMHGYGRAPGPEFRRRIKQFTLPVNPMVPIHGAIGIFHDTVMPCHTGVFAVCSETGRVTVIHSDAGKRRCVEEGYDDSSPSLKDRLVAIRLFQQVDYGI